MKSVVNRMIMCIALTFTFSAQAYAFDSATQASTDCLRRLGFIPSKSGDLSVIFNPKNKALCIYRESLATGNCYSEKDLKKCRRELPATGHIIIQDKGQLLLVITDENGVAAVTDDLKYEPPHQSFCNLGKKDDVTQVQKGFYDYVEFALAQTAATANTTAATTNNNEALDGILACQRSSDPTVSSLASKALTDAKNFQKNTPAQEKTISH